MGEVLLSLRLWPPGMCCWFTGFINNRQKQTDTKGAAVLSWTTLTEHPLRPEGYYQCLTGAVSTTAQPTHQKPSLTACVYPCSPSITSTEFRKE